jgi:hypothetical protein
VGPDGSISLLGSNIFWVAYEQQHGIVTNTTPVIKKVLDAGLQIDDPDLLKFTVTLEEADTLNLLGNYKHEALVIISGRRITVANGIMCITETNNREVGTT